MDVFWQTLIASVGGTLAGGITAGYFANRPWSLDRKDQGRMALRLWRDDFYHDQTKLCEALKSNGLWWSDLEEVGKVATSDQAIGTVSKQLDGVSWKNVSGARRRMIKLENQRRTDAEGHPGELMPPRSGGDPVFEELWKLYELMEKSRYALAVRDAELSKKGEDMTFEPHEGYHAVVDVVGHELDDPSLAVEP
jgi:hypothetical protein